MRYLVVYKPNPSYSTNEGISFGSVESDGAEEAKEKAWKRFFKEGEERIGRMFICSLGEISWDS